MREPASKRRKLSPSNEQSDNDSFASFGDELIGNEGELQYGNSEFDESSDSSSEEVDGEVNGVNDFDPEESEESSSGSENEEVNRMSDIGSEERMEEISGDNESTPSSQPKKSNPKRRTEIQQNGDPHGAAPFTGEAFKSNLFMLRVDDLLKQVRPKFQLKDKSIEQALRSLKVIIEGIPARRPASVVDADASLRNLHGVVVPFPDPKPSQDANYKLQYAKPTHINTVGSFPLRTGTKTSDDIIIDLVLTIPADIFQEKDYMNHRYFYKRAFYLGCVAAGIKANKAQNYKLNFDNLHGNQLLPILIVEVNRDTHPDHGLPCKIFKVVILPSIQEGTFAKEKLLPARNCVRLKDAAEGNLSQALPATPFYNASLMVDSLVTSYLELQHEVAKNCEAYKDACVLGRIWLRQRGFNGRIQGGGFGNFEWAVLTALLLRGGGSNGQPVFSSGYSSYQLFKATLQYLASKDLVKIPPALSSKIAVPSLKGCPIFFDYDRCLNLLFKMTPWSYTLLQHEARASVAMLSDSTFDHFDDIFIIKSDRPLYRSDVLIEIPINDIPTTAYSKDCGGASRYSNIYEKLSQGLADRVKLITLTFPEDRTWDTTKIASPAKAELLTIGFSIDPANAHRLIDHGPPAENKTEAAGFRDFWGDKAELRRFRDGSILESVIWSMKENSKYTIFRQVLSHIIEHHLGKQCLKAVKYFGDEGHAVLPGNSMLRPATTASFKPIMEAFRTLEKDLRGLEDIPLQIRHLLASDPQLSYSSVNVPFIPNVITMMKPADIILQFEGSARWPDDLDAIQRTKMAFFLKMVESLEDAIDEVSARVGLENEDAPLLNQSYLDVVYSSGAAFRIRIHHDREITLLERKLKDRSLSNTEKTEAAHAIATYKRIFIKEPAHTQALQTLSTRFPAFSGTVRLLTSWFSSHLLSNHFSPFLISLFAVRVFTNPYLWNAPSSPQAGLLRTLFLLSRWDWRTEPWIVDLGSDMRNPDVQILNTRFEAWRKIDPALNRVVLFVASNIDGDGNTWTDGGRPAKVVAGRMSTLAKAAVGLINTRGIELEFDDLFHSSFGEYDVIIYTNDTTPKKLKSSKRQYKNLELQSTSTTINTESIGFSPVKLFLADLERVFGNAMLFFYEEYEEAIIAGLWNPLNEERAWKLSLGYSAVPVGGEDGSIKVRINKEGILNEIARLGGRWVRKIEAVR